MLTVGLIGCGGMGSVHANCWLALSDRVKLVAIADAMPEKVKELAEKAGAKVYSSGDELLANETPDIIDICVPTYLHTSHAVAAMKKGCRVFMEKPVCLNEEEAQLLLDTQKETGARVQIGQVIRFWDEYVWLKKAADSGEYGKIVSGVFQRLSSNPKWAWENWYNDHKKSGTVALDLHIHDIDFIRYLMGCEPDKVSSSATRSPDGTIEQIFSTYSFGSSVITAEGCWDYPDNFPFSASYRIKFEKATVIYDGEKFVVYFEIGEKTEPEITKDFEADVDCGINISSLGAYFNEIKYFIDSIISESSEEIAPLCEAVKSARVAWKEVELSGGAKL